MITLKIEVDYNGDKDSATIEFPAIVEREFALLLEAARVNMGADQVKPASTIGGLISMGIDTAFEVYVKDRIRAIRSSVLDWVGSAAGKKV